MKAIASNGVEINTGDHVLIRDDSNEDWRYTYFSHKVNTSDWPYVSSYTGSIQCIPYKGNEHLVGTNNNYKSYKEKQNQWIEENSIKIGDKVKIIEKSFEGDNGWDMCWAAIMDTAVNETGIIVNIEKDSIGINVKDIGIFYYPYHVLEKVEDRFEFRFGAKVKAMCGDNTVEGILISYDKEDNNFPYCIAIQKEKNYTISTIEWVESIEYIK